MVRALADAGFLNDVELFDRQIEQRLRASNRTDCVLFLMNWHDRAEATRATALSAPATASRYSCCAGGESMDRKLLQYLVEYLVKRAKAHGALCPPAAADAAHDDLASALGR